jgi:hypothetical protein
VYTGETAALIAATAAVVATQANPLTVPLPVLAGAAFGDVSAFFASILANQVGVSAYDAATLAAQAAYLVGIQTTSYLSAGTMGIGGIGGRGGEGGIGSFGFGGGNGGKGGNGGNAVATSISSGGIAGNGGNGGDGGFGGGGGLGGDAGTPGTNGSLVTTNNSLYMLEGSGGLPGFGGGIGSTGNLVTPGWGRWIWLRRRYLCFLMRHTQYYRTSNF